MTKNTRAGAPAVNSMYSLYLKYTLSYQSTLRESKCVLFWSLHFLSASFYKISSKVSRNMLKIETESYFHLIVSKRPISTAKLQDKEIFHGFWDFARNLATTWRNSFSPPPQNRLCFISFLQVWAFHSVWYVRHCTASTVVPKYGPHLVYTWYSIHIIDVLNDIGQYTKKLPHKKVKTWLVTIID